MACPKVDLFIAHFNRTLNRMRGFRAFSIKWTIKWAIKWGKTAWEKLSLEFDAAEIFAQLGKRGPV